MRFATVSPGATTGPSRWHAFPVAGRPGMRAYTVRVSDDGVGIPPEVQRRIFDRFFTTHRRDGGTGLGMYVVKTLVDRLGGTISLQSKPGAGATFQMVFPANFVEST